VPSPTASLHEGPVSEVLGEWRALHSARPCATPFMSAEWAAAWWPHYAGDADGFVWRVEEDGRVIGLVPLVRRRRGPLRILEPVGMDPGDYWDQLAAPGRERDVAAAFAAALEGAAGRWDAWILRCLVPGSPVVGALEARALRALVRPPIPSPAIELPESFDAYLAGLSGNRRSNLRKHLRRLDGGEVELEQITDVERLPGVIERWREFRRSQWDAAGRDINPEHLSPRFSAFMLDVMRALVPRGTGLVWEFKVDGKVVGSYLNFADAEAFHWYLGGFDPAVTKLGLGKIAIAHGIRTSIEAGRRRYDFGRGAEDYKYFYGAVDRPLEARVVGSRRPRSRIALAGARAVLSRRGG
jgi:CelD/BcsL family acetyltransferase involved in cellulose biosynthesis